MYAGFGLVAGSLAPLIGPIRGDLSLSASTMGLVLGAWQLVYLFSAIPGGRVIDRLGSPVTIGLAAAVVCVSGLARAAAGGPVTLYLAVAAFGVGGPLISIGGPKLIAQWFAPAHRSGAVGIYSTAPATGTMIALASTNSVAVPLTGSWRGALALDGLVAGATGVVWVLVAVGARGRTPFPATAPATAQGPRGGRSRALLRTSAMRLVLAMAVLSFLFNHGVGNWLVEMLRDGGRSAVAAGNLAALTTMVGIAATAVVPRVATPPRRRTLHLVLFAVGAVGIAAVPHLDGPAVVGALVAVGVTRAAALPLAMIVLMDDPDIGPANMAAAGGLYFTAGEIGGVAGPWAVGAASESAGGFGLAAALLAGAALVLAGLSTRLPGGTRPVEDWEPARSL